MPEFSSMLLAVLIGGFTIIGGLGGTFYVSYINGIFIFSVILILQVSNFWAAWKMKNIFFCLGCRLSWLLCWEQPDGKRVQPDRSARLLRRGQQRSCHQLQRRWLWFLGIWVDSRDRQLFLVLRICRHRPIQLAGEATKNSNKGTKCNHYYPPLSPRWLQSREPEHSASSSLVSPGWPWVWVKYWWWGWWYIYYDEVSVCLSVWHKKSSLLSWAPEVRSEMFARPCRP